MKKLYLVDISSLFFRAFYAVRPLTSPSGLPTNAVYGVLSMLIKLIKDEKPDYMVVCYDRKEPSFRKKIYAEYKANRTEMPEDLEPQIPVIKKLVELMGIPSLEVPDYEADDLIGTLAKVGKRQNYQVYIMSGDKDFGQIIETDIYLYDTMKSEKLGPDEVENKWGVRPEQFIDYLALVGDSSDNIPGVHGIGPKGAQTLLKDFSNLEGIYKNLEKIKSENTRNKLIANKENAFLSQKLVTIVTDVPLPIDFEKFHYLPRKSEELRNFLKELNFKTFEKAIFENTTQAQTQIKSEKQLNISKLNNFSHSEVEINQLDKVLNSGETLYFALAVQGVYVSNGQHIYKLQGSLSELGCISDLLKIKWKGFDLKTFWHQIEVKNPIAAWDSMLAAYVLKPGEMMDFSKVYSWITGELLAELPTGEDLIQAQIMLEQEITSQLNKVHLLSVFTELDLPLVTILYAMERKGIKLDQTLLQEQGSELAKEIRDLEIKIHDLAGVQFNIGSPKQLSQVLFEKLKLTAYKKTKTGFSTDNEVLEKLKVEHPIIVELLQYRELTKLKSTYVDALPNLIKSDGRIHTTFRQAFTTTGRLSSVDPNLQNIPIKTDRGARVRKAFVASEGKSLLSVDYSQIELRILAHYSGDPNLIKAFEEDLDIHAATASEVFSVNLIDVTDKMRRTAKAVNFGIAYGQGAFGLAETLGIPRSEAQDIIKRYFTRFSYVKNYIDDTIEKAKEQGFVETLYGRRRYIDELKSNNIMIKKFGERAAINAPIQGSASDIVKKAMIDVHKVTNLDMLLQVHDELIFEGESRLVQAEKPQIIQIMENVIKLKVPLKVNCTEGPNWDL